MRAIQVIFYEELQLLGPQALRSEKGRLPGPPWILRQGQGPGVRTLSPMTSEKLRLRRANFVSLGRLALHLKITKKFNNINVNKLEHHIYLGPLHFTIITSFYHASGIMPGSPATPVQSCRRNGMRCSLVLRSSTHIHSLATPLRNSFYMSRLLFLLMHSLLPNPRIAQMSDSRIKLLLSQETLLYNMICPVRTLEAHAHSALASCQLQLYAFVQHCCTWNDRCEHQ